MGPIGAAILKLILEAALAAFTHFLADLIKTFKADQAAQEKGRLEATTAQAQAGEQARQRMEAVGDDLDIRKLLKDGEA